MQAFLSAPWLIVVAPALVALLLGVLGGKVRAVAAPVAILGPVLTAVYGAMSLLEITGSPHSAEAWNTSAVVSEGSLPWFSLADAGLELAWAVDSLTAIMLFAVGIVATCVVIFSIGYLHGEKGWVRYFALLSLFTASMNLLVIASSFTTLFIGWELVGACSFLLIGFWYEKPAAAAAAVKAFLTTRVGDVGLLLGIGLLWSAAGSDSFAVLLSPDSGVDAGILAAAAVCLAVGAMGKSAQFPLHAWLPDAMEGPTPVSALIHAATMVAAGVFLVVRVSPLFEAAPIARDVLLVAGAVSALGAALVAVVQRDIKKVLAYSTVSQLGFMFAALGVGAWGAAFFHLIAHAAFKALLFLASGSVIHGAGTQDLHEMGGLRKQMPYTFAVWVIGALALAGVFPFAGFFSKDAVLEAVFHESPVVGVMLFAASALTAFYAARSTRLAFFGAPAKASHAHEGGAVMVLPLIALAVPAATLGFANGAVAELLGHEPEPLALGISAAALALAAVGGIAGWFASAGPEGDERTARALGPLRPVLASAYRWNELVHAVVVAPAVALSRALWAVGDRLIADGFVEGSARLAKSVGARFSSLQTGDAQTYGIALTVGVLLMLVASVWIGR